MKSNKRCNDLSGKEWLQNSFSIWRNHKKTPEEKRFYHPASYPLSLAEKLIETFSKRESIVLDPFNGIGSTCVAASNLGRKAIGIDLQKKYCDIAKTRINDPNIDIIQGDSFQVVPNFPDNYFDLCVTSPPYWDILNMRRTADIKDHEGYSNLKEDLGNIDDYSNFLNLLGELFEIIQPKLKPSAYLLINVMDIRKGKHFYPLHSDLAYLLKDKGYIFDDLIIWDRQIDYNNMRPLGYPYKFRINKVHEYILIFVK